MSHKHQGEFKSRRRTAHHWHVVDWVMVLYDFTEHDQHDALLDVKHTSEASLGASGRHWE